MLTVFEWNSLLNLSPSDFKYPDGLNYGIVSKLDRFISRIGSKPIVLSDWRPSSGSGDKSQHPRGNAIDVTYPGVDSSLVLNEAKKIFNGIGVYINESGIVSYHFDDRPESDFVGGTAPDLWGGVITHPIDVNSGEAVKQIEYTTMDVVIDMIKKKGLVLTISLIASLFVIYLIRSR